MSTHADCTVETASFGFSLMFAFFFAMARCHVHGHARTGSEREEIMKGMIQTVKTGLFSAFLMGLLTGQVGWTRELCDDFVGDPDPLDGIPMEWYICPWGPVECAPAPEGEEGMDIRRAGPAAGHLCTQEVFAGDCTFWLRASNRGEGGFMGITGHFNFQTITGYSLVFRRGPGTLNIEKWQGADVDPPVVVATADLPNYDYYDPNLILEFELKVTGERIEGRVWDTNKSRPVDARVWMRDSTFRAGQASIFTGDPTRRLYEYCVSESTPFVRGDASADSETDISDAVFVLQYLFSGKAAPSCEDAADADDNGALEITDAVYLLHYLFLGGPPPKAPFPDCGPDPTVDVLGCESFPPCEGS
jgi:hypothetical protein